MTKPTKIAIKQMTNQEAMVLCNELGLPEGSKEEMIQSLLKHYCYKKE